MPSSWREGRGIGAKRDGRDRQALNQADVPAVPPDDGYDEVGGRHGVVDRGVHRGAEPVLDLGHGRFPPKWSGAGADALPAASRNLARARAAWLLTVPILQPSASATSASEKPS